MTSVQGMGTIAAKYWWLLLVRGILLIVLGIMMLAWPNATITVFAVLFAAFLFVDGVLEIVQGFQDRKVGQPSAGNFTLGALAIIFGSSCLFWPRGVLDRHRHSHCHLGHPGGCRRDLGRHPAAEGQPARAGAGSWPWAFWPESSASP